MLFNSPHFIFLYLPFVFVSYFVLNAWSATQRFSKLWLVTCSLFFYGWWNPAYLPLILISIVANYRVGRYLNSHKSKPALIAGIVFNLGLLGYFKYLDFILSNVNSLFSANLTLLNIALPLAISFYTFQQISYIIDCYNGKVKEQSLINYSLFVTFFPQLVAGPIVHHRQMMPQFLQPANHRINYENISLGIYIFSIGLFKKVILADQFSTTVASGMGVLDTITFFDAWIVALSYTFQLYFDFSGYSDMAVGLGLLFNIRIPINFNSPYKATNIQEMMSRWHITLTRFLYEYVYVPVNRKLSRSAFMTKTLRLKTEWITSLSLVLLFLISGIWHGAGWNFIIWGLLIGAGIIIYRLWRKTSIKLPKAIAWGITFLYVNFILVFFKISAISDALTMIKAMLGLSGAILPVQFDSLLQPFTQLEIRFEATPLEHKAIALFYIIIGFVLILCFKNTSEKAAVFKPSLINALYIILIFIYTIMNLNRISEFLYFNF
ncbi:MBOAT family O-acyltransferase [Paenibacillus sp. NPDC057967]|uniref:MBOAT family O-acyltransferase n=1 Tax=Paenibacillus sp. NPDC057967 TaxID=3346293 RepID=UPI0036DA0BF6